MEVCVEHLRELKSRNDCKYCTLVSKFVYSSRRSICCIGRRCNGAMLGDYYRYIPTQEVKGVLDVEVLHSCFNQGCQKVAYSLLRQSNLTLL